MLWAITKPAGAKIGTTEEGMRLIDGGAVDHLNNVYISDAYSHKVRKISAEGQGLKLFDVSNIEGGHSDASLDMGIDEDENLYVVRRGGHMVHKYDRGGKAVDSFETYAPVMQMILTLR
ncbi:MAG: hypothetical protein R2865_07465 [Deinococcales bacterium]